jgi:hypothetical protein
MTADERQRKEHEMPIEGGLRGKLEPGTVLVARYKGAEHTAEVVSGEEGKARYRLADGREFGSPWAAGSAVMGGVACNGWRFWSLATGEAETPPAKQPRAKATQAAKKPARSAKAKPEAEPERATPEAASEQPAEPGAAAE